MIVGAVSLYLAIIAELPMFVLLFVVIVAINLSFLLRNINVRKNLIASAVSRV